MRSNRLACYRCYYSIALAVLSLLALLKESVTRKGRQLNYYFEFRKTLLLLLSTDMIIHEYT